LVLRADVHDGKEHNCSVQGPDTEAQDQAPPYRHFRLATRGGSIQMGHGHCSITSSGNQTWRHLQPHRSHMGSKHRMIAPFFVDGTDLVFLPTTELWKIHYLIPGLPTREMLCRL
jgi:hypothetical protein